MITKGWLGGKKAKSSVSPSHVVRLLNSQGATTDILQIFLQLIDDLDDRETLARRVKVPNVVIDCLVAKRDRIGLERYREKLTTHSPEWFYADHTLNTSSTKWKN